LGFPDVQFGGLKALESPEAAGGFGVVALIAAYFEVIFWVQDPSKAPGDFGDPLSMTRKFKEFKYTTDMRNKELNHGRLAMSLVGTDFLFEYFTKEDPLRLYQNTPNGVFVAAFFVLFGIWSNYPQEYQKDWYPEEPQKALPGPPEVLAKQA
jgi:hypothetical protein